MGAVPQTRPSRATEQAFTPARLAAGPQRPNGGSPTETQLQQLQRAAGNAAVTALIQGHGTLQRTGPTTSTTQVDDPSLDPTRLRYNPLQTTSLLPKLQLSTQPATPTPNLVRDPGCPVVAPDLPVVPTPIPFTPDPTHALPAKEEAPDLSTITDSADFWGHKDAQDFAGGLADCYASRTASNPKPVDRAAKFAELTTDFNSVVRASFARHPEFNTAWPLPGQLAAILTRRRARILTELQAANLARKKDDRLSKDQLDAALEARMQPERHQLVEDVRQAVEVGIWGWMVERREKLDFDTIKQTYTGKSARLPDILSDTDVRGLVHDILVDAKAELTPEDRQKAIDAAQAAKDAAAKKKNEQPAPLTDEEKAAAISKAEDARLQQQIARGKVKGGELRARKIKARTEKEAADLVSPEDVKVKGWSKSDPKHTRIHKDVVKILQSLESEFPAGFSAGTYTGSIEGDHASSGFEGRFRSVDIYPNGGLKKTGNKAFDQIFGFGFFDQQVAFSFALAIDRACSSNGATFQILYNDFVVAREANKVIKNGRLFNVDNVTGEGGGNMNLNWHGPLVTHFHVDFAT